MLFSDFFNVLGLDVKNIDSSLLNKNIVLLCQDDSKIQESVVFFAKKGTSFNGADFVLANSNINFVSIIESRNEKTKELLNTKNVVVVSDLEDIIKKSIKLFYSKRPKYKIAVTGTNGKSSVVCFIRQILSLLNTKSASVGTLGYYANNELIEETLTTPSYLDMARYTHNTKEQGIDFFALETSSHGILQGRIKSIEIDVASFLNLSQDHLDYHKDMESYYNAKKLLFTKYLKSSNMVINIDDSYGLRLFNEIEGKSNENAISYGKNLKSKLVIKDIKNFASYQHVYISYLGKDYNFKLNMLGDFQVYNILCAICMILLTKEFSLEEILQTMEYIKAEKGRLELVASYDNALYYVDYAHTPSALEAVLSSLKKDLKGKLHVVFGCGGDRDKTKRPQMGKIAYNLADFVYITDDNPRTENADLIRKETASFDNIKIKEITQKDLESLKQGQEINKGFRVFDIKGRENAITFASYNLKSDDVLLIAGKGHEQYQIIGTKKQDFSDYKVIEQILSDKKKSL